MSPERFFELLTWHDAVDILAVTIVVYNLLLLIRGTRAVQMLLGIVFTSALLVIVVNFCVDLLYAKLDPRIAADR